MRRVGHVVNSALALRAIPASSQLMFQQRFQSQSRPGTKGQYGENGVVDPRYSASQHWKKFNPDTAPHYVKAMVQNERKEMGLSPVVDWKDFAEEAIAIPSRRGEIWVGADDPRCAKFVKRREKMKEKVAQVPRKQPSVDPAQAIQDHPFRQFFVTPATLTDPMTVADGLYRAGMVKEYDVKFTAGKINYESRPPIVSIMGHVDHGKTTLLDYLRKTNVASGEAGGITQSIGAFSVATPDGNRVTFVDTPGHAAFSNMREVGAQITDMIVLIVSTVDGVQPQTVEVIKLAQEKLIPLVVACSKIDRNPNMDKIKADLRANNVELEEDGGDVQVVGISSIDGTGIPSLLEAISLQAALSEISTPTPSRCEVSIIESIGVGDEKTNEVCGIVRCGVLKPGITLVSGLSYATVRAVYDETRKNALTSAGPGTPVVIHGFKALPKPGNILMQVSSLSHAEKFYMFMKDVYLVEGKREDFLRTQNSEAKGNFFARKPEYNNSCATDDVTVNLVVKADSFGRLQALLRQVYSLPKIKGVTTVMKTTEVGPLRTVDTMLASGGTGHPSVILLYGSVADKSTADQHHNTTTLQFDVLYHGIQMLKESLVSRLPPLKKERITGSADCQQTFKASQAGRNGNAGGFVVKSGVINADHMTFRVLRKPSKDATPEVVYEGQIKELRRFKDLVPSVEQGMECGIIVYDEFQFRPGDVLEQVETYEEPRDVESVFDEAYKQEEIMRQMAMTMDQTSGESSEAPSANAKKAA